MSYLSSILYFFTGLINLIDRRHVLTAAHCLQNDIIIDLVNEKITDISEPFQRIAMAEFNVEDETDGQVNVNISDIIVHPGLPDCISIVRGRT